MTEDETLQVTCHFVISNFTLVVNSLIALRIKTILPLIIIIIVFKTFINESCMTHEQTGLGEFGEGG